MAAYDDVADQVAGQGKTVSLPNFVGPLFKLSPLETPYLSLIGGYTGGRPAESTVFTWQDTLHRFPALQAVAEGADAAYTAQKRAQRKNVVMIHQYGVEISYTKQAATGMLGGTGNAADAADPFPAASILGNQPVQSEMSWQLRIKMEQAALDIEKAFLEGTFTFPNDGTARQTQGITGAVSADTTTDYLNGAPNPGVPASRDVVNDLAKKLFDNGAPMRNVVIMVNSLNKVNLGKSYAALDGGWNVQPRSYNIFGVNVTDLETEFGRFPVVLNRHLDANSLLMVELDVCAPRFLPIPNKGHFFLEPLSKVGSYDRAQLYGEIGLEYGPAGWHAIATNLNTFV